MKFKSEIQAFFNNLRKKFVDPMVKKTMKDVTPPPDLMVPERLWKEQIKKELRDLYSSKSSMERLEDGFFTLLHDLPKHLSSAQMKDIYGEWEQGVAKWAQHIESQNATAEKDIDAMPSCLQEIMNISEETINAFYDCGCRHFKAKDYSKAANIFFAITSFDYRRHNVWLSLGLCEMQNLHWEQALNSFGMATMTNMDTPLPSLYSAECCIAMGNKSDAKDYLELATLTAKAHSVEDRKSFENHLNRLRHQL